VDGSSQLDTPRFVSGVVAAREYAKYREALTFAHFVKHMSLGSPRFAAERDGTDPEVGS
jgi:hypothetical protein